MPPISSGICFISGARPGGRALVSAADDEAVDSPLVPGLNDEVTQGIFSPDARSADGVVGHVKQQEQRAADVGPLVELVQVAGLELAVGEEGVQPFAGNVREEKLPHVRDAQLPEQDAEFDVDACCT